jgi:ferredoxin--NADP+ reductase
VRTAAELTYQDEISSYKNLHPEQFIYAPFVSRESFEPGLTGRIPDAIEDGKLEKWAGLQLDASRSQVMICGNPGMVRDTIAVLEHRGLKKNRRNHPGQITTESYW